ncbi:MAG: hypothetical protein M0Z79_02525 [Nitrospiraceae bacterium]|nr:hypothetical protein [Nitrospiraceae bacterium]
MIKKGKWLVVVSMLLVANLTYAEAPKLSPEQQQQLIQQQMQMMTPMFGQMMKAMLEAHLDVLANTATAEKLATFSKNYYDALVKKGFTKEEAFRITMSVGFPSLPSMQK